MKKFIPLAVGFIIAALYSAYFAFPLWRDYKIHTPFGGSLIVEGENGSNDKIELVQGRWFNVDDGHKLSINGDRLVYSRNGTILGVLIVKDKYGEGLAKVTNVKSIGSTAMEIWVIRK